VSLDPAAIARDAPLDGQCVLRTTTALDPAEVVRAYRSLWRVERTFRKDPEHAGGARPGVDRRDDPTIGDIVG
jgi:hypothetical protein